MFVNLKSHTRQMDETIKGTMLVTCDKYSGICSFGGKIQIQAKGNNIS